MFYECYKAQNPCQNVKNDHDKTDKDCQCLSQNSLNNQKLKFLYRKVLDAKKLDKTQKCCNKPKRTEVVYDL